MYTKFSCRNFLRLGTLLLRFRHPFLPFTEPSAELDMMFLSGPNKGQVVELVGQGEVSYSNLNYCFRYQNIYRRLALWIGLEVHLDHA